MSNKTKTTFVGGGGEGGVVDDAPYHLSTTLNRALLSLVIQEKLKSNHDLVSNNYVNFFFSNRKLLSSNV